MIIIELKYKEWIIIKDSKERNECHKDINEGDIVINDCMIHTRLSGL